MGDWFIVERYLPGLTPGSLEVAAAHDRHVADDLIAHGVPVGQVRTICVPGDETCFSMFDAPSAGVIEAAFRRIGVHFDRITEAIEMRCELDGHRSPGI